MTILYICIHTHTYVRIYVPAAMYLCNLTSVAADEMGLGKTLTFISLVMKDLPRERKWREAGPATHGEEQLHIYMGGSDTSLGTSLAFSVLAALVAWFKMSTYMHVGV